MEVNFRLGSACLLFGTIAFSTYCTRRDSKFELRAACLVASE